jgi:hypothetical protein
METGPFTAVSGSSLSGPRSRFDADGRPEPEASTFVDVGRSADSRGD